MLQTMQEATTTEIKTLKEGVRIFEEEDVSSAILQTIES